MSVGPECPDCGASTNTADIWWEDEAGNEIPSIDSTVDPAALSDRKKMVARECYECGCYWEYEVE